MRDLSSPSMPRRLPPGCSRTVTGTATSAFTTVRKVDLRSACAATPWTPEFMAAYEAAKGIEFKTSDRSRAALPGTWRWLCVRYFSECAEYKRLDARTQRVRRQILEGTFDEPIAPKSERFFRDFPLAKMNANAVEVLRDRKLSTPEAANGRVKAMRQVFKWGVAKGHAPFNPAREVAYFKSGSEGFHTWTPEEVQQFEERHPVGTQGTARARAIALHRSATVGHYQIR